MLSTLVTEPDALSSPPLMCLVGAYQDGAVFRNLPGALAVLRLAPDANAPLEAWNDNLRSLLSENLDINSVMADHRAVPSPGNFADSLISLHRSLDRSPSEHPLVFVTVGAFTGSGPELLKWMQYCQDQDISHYLTPRMDNAQRWLKQQGLREGKLPPDYAVFEQAMLFHSNYVGSVYLHYEQRVVIVQSSGFDSQVAVDRIRLAIAQAAQMWGTSVVVMDCRKTNDLPAALTHLSNRPQLLPKLRGVTVEAAPVRALVLIHDNPEMVDRFKPQLMAVYGGRFLDVADLRQGMLAGAAYAMVPPPSGP